MALPYSEIVTDRPFVPREVVRLDVALAATEELLVAAGLSLLGDQVRIPLPLAQELLEVSGFLPSER